ncbi:dihydroxyacetone kinase phosphoryl donor subunit DhaM [Globicatella sulfidifaciens]|uniref:phosphoenolpyruvate--glycerone phosphotransferase n=1 Tax=Globicatella sulfidifaciens TaxID=136093 RepID=A0A7X8C486_9LACT|nr:dihydroxyacetone kinase phosphoryl donor subunit DhaM [Globicatella sulfidifaciens]NLJ18499.1 PTS-dependent dihydroxyacetone kinase phosphotransferase subunit DhaM [Globicatella sulfidifaciens]
MAEYGIVIVSHSFNLAQGVYDLISEVSKDINVTCIGGTEDKTIGTDFNLVLNAIETNASDHLLAFFDLGSARMNLELAMDMSEKDITIFQVPIVEGAYTASALLQAGAPIESIKEQLKELEIVK